VVLVTEARDLFSDAGDRPGTYSVMLVTEVRDLFRAAGPLLSLVVTLCGFGGR
jgi:hypothetical protein